MIEDCFVVIIDKQYFTIDEEDLHFLKSGIWRVSTQGYARRSSGERELLHRLILSASKGESVDHIDGNIRNNCKSNLRICSIGENLKNRKLNANNKTGFKGVVRSSFGNRWRARITSDGVRIALGSYATAEEANEAYIAAAKKLHGEFHRSL